MSGCPGAFSRRPPGCTKVKAARAWNEVAGKRLTPHEAKMVASPQGPAEEEGRAWRHPDVRRPLRRPVPHKEARRLGLSRAADEDISGGASANLLTDIIAPLGPGTPPFPSAGAE